MSAPQPSLYERIASSHVAAFGDGYTGTPNAAALIVGTQAPTRAEKSALEASFSQLGYAKSALGWIALDETAQSESAEGDAAQRLFDLIEGIGPLCVVALNHAATAALSRSFNAPLALETKTLLLGHACRCFENLDALLSTEAGKRKAWELLKTCPKLA